MKKATRLNYSQRSVLQDSSSSSAECPESRPSTRNAYDTEEVVQNSPRLFTMARAVLVAVSLALLAACVSSSPAKKYDYEADGWIHPDPDNYDGIKVWNGKNPTGDSDEEGDGNTALEDFLAAHPEWADEKNAYISPQAFGRKPIPSDAEKRDAPPKPPGKKRTARSAEL